jgi:hypothetical protein
MARERSYRDLAREAAKEPARARPRVSEFIPPAVEDAAEPHFDATAETHTEGAQSLMFSRVLKAANEALPLLDKLQVLGREANQDEVKQLKHEIRTECSEMIGELALTGGPSMTRVEEIFSLLLDQLGALQEHIEDDENVSKFRILADYVASLFRSWNNMQQIFATHTLIVLQQFVLVADAVEEARFTMENAGLDSEERRRMPIRNAHFASGAPSVSVEDLLLWIEDFVAAEGPQVIEEAGGFSLRNTVLPIVKRMRGLVTACTAGSNLANFPRSWSTSTVQRAIRNLEAKLDELAWNC